MKIIKNDKLIERNGKIGNWTSIGGLIVLGLGMYISFTRQDLVSYAFVALLLGFILTQISIYMGNRFGRSPRPDESLDAGLKGLPGDFTIYHYTTPASHLMVGPAGIWVLLPYRLGGTVTYEKNRWKLKGGGFLQGYMRLFGQEGIGRPDVEADADIKSLQKEFSKHMDVEQIPPISALLVFTDENVELDTADAPMPAMKIKQIKDFMRQKAKEKPLSAEQIEKVKAILG
jgi:hypothetical protein